MRQTISDMLIRKMTVDDLLDVLVIDRLSFPLPWSERSYRFELQENPSAHLIVAERITSNPPTLIGYVGFWLLADEVHISTLAVHPKNRRNGIGEELLVAAFIQGIGLGAETATLEVRESNDAALGLYRKHGFKIVGRRARYYRDNHEDALLMTLESLREWHAMTVGGRG